MQIVGFPMRQLICYMVVMYDVMCTCTLKQCYIILSIIYFLPTARYGDYFRLLANGNYKVTAAVAIKGDNGQEEIITRTTCVTVYNDPRDYKEALEVDFDFRDLSKKEHTYGCIPRQV